MPDGRGFWLLAVLFAVTVFAVAGEQSNILLLSTTLLVWFFAEWIWFYLRARILIRRLKIKRLLNGQALDRRTLWAREPAHIVVEISTESRVAMRYMRVTDRPPAIGVITGQTSVEGTVKRDHPLRLEYEFRSPSPGQVRFEGAKVEIADMQGFFQLFVFLRQPVQVTVLPSLVDERSNHSAIKKFNILPSQGVHRFRRPGSGSELLDLRDYVAGDPPKTVAWKVSAPRQVDDQGIRKRGARPLHVVRRCIRFGARW